jgi:hypothetical protein
MKPVPLIDSLFYEKVLIKEATLYSPPQEGNLIYLNAYDPDGDCRFYRWDYIKTWKFQTPYMVANQVCWISSNSKNIDVTNTSVLSEDRVIRHLVIFISNETDRLSERYGIIVNQYSLSENEFAYWEKIKNISHDVGGLYDKIPSSIAGNLFCIEDPGEQVLGYFSVSAKASKRIYIDELFRGLVNPYKECPADTFAINRPIPGLDVYRWIIYENPSRGIVVTTYDQSCADCTARGTTTRPEFWEDFK